MRENDIGPHVHDPSNFYPVRHLRDWFKCELESYREKAAGAGRAPKGGFFDPDSFDYHEWEIESQKKGIDKKARELTMEIQTLGVLRWMLETYESHMHEGRAILESMMLGDEGADARWEGFIEKIGHIGQT